MGVISISSSSASPSSSAAAKQSAQKYGWTLRQGLGAFRVLADDERDVPIWHRRCEHLIAVRRTFAFTENGIGQVCGDGLPRHRPGRYRSEEHTSELQSHSFISYAVF